MESQLESYTNTEIGGGNSSDSESRVLELKLKALILDTIHAIDVVQQLIKHGVKSLDDWIWQKQLRFYMQKQRGLLSNESCHWLSHNCGTKKLLSPTRGIESHAFGTSMLYHRTLLTPLIQAVYRKPVVYDREIALLTSEFSVVQWGTRMFFFFPSLLANNLPFFFLCSHIRVWLTLVGYLFLCTRKIGRAVRRQGRLFRLCHDISSHCF